MNIEMKVSSYGDRIKKVLKDKGMKQVELAEKLKVSPAYINQLILSRRNPGMDNLFKIAEALEVPIESLLPEKQTGNIPLLFQISAGKGYCEYQPEDWKTNWDSIAAYLPLPPGYTVRGAEREMVFAVSIADNRLHPALRRNMEVYLKPYKIKPYESLYNLLVLLREDSGECFFREIETKNNSLIIKDLLTGETTLSSRREQLTAKIYKVINILVP